MSLLEMKCVTHVRYTGDGIAGTLFVTEWRLLFTPDMGNATVNHKVPLSVPTATIFDVNLSPHKEKLFALRVSSKTGLRMLFTWKRLRPELRNVAKLKAAEALHAVKLLRNELLWAMHEG